MVLTSTAERTALRPDVLGRTLRKLRIQLTDACNLRCVYCMPHDQTFLPSGDLLTPGEFGEIGRELRDLGIAEARITGGEPTVRADVVRCVEEIAKAAWERLGLTTNGLRLAEHAAAFAAAGLDGANVSLDSLDRDNFRRIAGRDGLASVLAGIDAARAAGLEVKINTVTMRGRNDHEFAEFVRWARREDLEIRFLEAMRVGPLAQASRDVLIPSLELRRRLERELGEAEALRNAPDATATRWRFPNGAVVGFVSSESEPFCGGCSRLRLSARGTLRSCLFRPEGTSIRGLHGTELARAVQREALLKPLSRTPSIDEGMNRIGG